VIWWIVLGLVVVGLVLLVAVVLSVLRRLSGLDRALAASRRRAADAEALRPALDALQTKLSEVSAHAEAVSAQVARIGGSEPEEQV
jgi:biopolymer transport protein ExbB/TolQ